MKTLRLFSLVLAASAALMVSNASAQVRGLVGAGLGVPVGDFASANDRDAEADSHLQAGHSGEPTRRGSAGGGSRTPTPTKGHSVLSRARLTSSATPARAVQGYAVARTPVAKKAATAARSSTNGAGGSAARKNPP